MIDWSRVIVVKHLWKSLFSEGWALWGKLDTSQKKYVCLGSPDHPRLKVPTLNLFSRQSAKNYRRPTCQFAKNLFTKCSSEL